jgi:hypothetical protein
VDITGCGGALHMDTITNVNTTIITNSPKTAVIFDNIAVNRVGGR